MEAISYSHFPGKSKSEKGEFFVDISLWVDGCDTDDYYDILLLTNGGGGLWQKGILKIGVDIRCVSQPWVPTSTLFSQWQLNPLYQCNPYELPIFNMLGKGEIGRYCMAIPLLE